MEHSPKKEPSRKKLLDDYGRYAGLGFQMAGAIFLFTWLGKLADDYFHTNNLLILAGAIIGIGSGMYFLFKAVSKK